MSGIAQARIALNRFGLGACPGDVARISADPLGWLTGQLAIGAAPLVPGVDSAATRIQSNILYLPTPDLTARIAGAVASPAPFLERLALFWANHLAVSGLRNTAAGLAVPYENEAIRPNIGTTFLAMLSASQRHPAMLYYLDLAGSIGPNSPLGQKTRRSYNENYARELMELHTVGVDGGYTPADVVELSLALTGWNVNRATGQATYDTTAHEPGQRTVLGTTLAAGDGHTDAALVMLANHPATIRRVCTKLAAHFIADIPPADTVAAMVAAWGRNGNLSAIYAAMLGSRSAWTAPEGKYKTPEAFILSTARAIAMAPGRETLLLHNMGVLGQSPLMPPSPKAYADDQASWLAPYQVGTRLDVAASLARFAARTLQPAALFGEMLTPTPQSHTTDAMCAAASTTEAFALLLASPEFQRR